MLYIPKTRGEFITSDQFKSNIVSGGMLKLRPFYGSHHGVSISIGSDKIMLFTDRTGAINHADINQYFAY